VPQLKMDEDAQRAYYESHKQSYAGPDRLKLRQISLADQDKAAAARAELVKGTEFGWLARAQSVDEQAEKGGQLGWVEEDRLNPKARQALKSLPNGGLTEVLHVGRNYQILLVEGREPGEPRPFDRVRRQVTSDLYSQELERVRREVAAQLRQGAQVSIDEGQLERLKERFFPADGASK
jgi:parvulin-like peptidyl-prolyl isomerase